MKKAAAHGQATAQCNKKVYYKGDGVVQNFGQAVEWHEKTAVQGNADAQYSLGVACQNGKGIAQDYEKAVEGSRRQQRRGLRTHSILPVMHATRGWVQRKTTRRR